MVGSALGAFLPGRERFATTVTVFGGGALLGALAFDVVPEAKEHAGIWWTALGIALGCGAFLAVDWLLTRDEGMRELRRALQSGSRAEGEEAAGRGKSIALGVLMDGIPETAALGITIAEGRIALALLAGILISNLAESYGASQPITAAGYSRRYPIVLFLGIGVALLGAIIAGATLLADTPDVVIGTGEAIAGGAIFATVLIAVIPHAFAEVSRWAAVSALGGFVLAFLLA